MLASSIPTTKIKHTLEPSAKKFKDAPPEIAPQETQTKPPCKYGAACYRANPTHRAEFWHPSDTKPSATLSHFEAPTQASTTIRESHRQEPHTPPQHLEDGGFENADTAMHDSPHFQKEKSSTWSEMGDNSLPHDEKTYHTQSLPSISSFLHVCLQGMGPRSR